MGNLSQYDFSGTKPEFSKPSCAKTYPYSNNVGNPAHDVLEAKSIAQQALNELENIDEDLRALKEKLTSLQETWNKCIKMDGAYQEYVVVDDVSRSTIMIDSAIENKDSILSLIDGYDQTISEIKSYQQEVANNAETHNSLVTSKRGYEAAYANAIEQNKGLYLSALSKVNKQLEEYQDVGNIEDCGRWV